MANHLFLASTPFNAIVSAMIALELPDQDRCELWLIDQPKTPTQFTDALMSWKESPFQKTQISSTKSSTIREKLSRKKALESLRTSMIAFGPDFIYTGNDRRIEFQYLIHHSEPSAKGVYIDDGTYTYIGRKSHAISDKIINNLIKKIVYGSWWKQPLNVGDSDWISEIHVAFPEMVISSLKNKKQHSLPKNLNRREFLSLASHFSENAEKMSTLDGLLLLPHHSASTTEASASLINQLRTFSNPGIKFHPRADDVPTLPENFIEVPRDIPFELLLPLIPDRATIIGDVSTALLTSKWLRPEIKVRCYAKSEAPLTELMRKIGIEVITE